MRRIPWLRQLVILALFVAWSALVLMGCGSSRTTSTLKILPPHQSVPSQSAMGSVAPKGWGSTPKGYKNLPQAVAPAPTAEMLDGIYVSTFAGLKPFSVAGYTAGLWPDYLGLRAAFPQAHAISIAIFAIYHADCLDVEPGDAVPSQAGSWVLADMKAGFPRPCVYFDLSESAAVQASLRATLGPNWRAHVFLWLAWYRYVPGLVSGYDAVQWSNHGGNLAPGRNLDQSTVTLSFLSIAQPPYSPPPPPLVCFPKPSNVKKCAPIIKQVQNYQSAARSSKKASDGTQQAIDRLVKRKAMFDQRVRYFTGKAQAEIKRYSS